MIEIKNGDKINEDSIEIQLKLLAQDPVNAESKEFLDGK